MVAAGRTRSDPWARTNSRCGTRSRPRASANSRCGTRSRPRASANSRCGTRSHPRAPANSRCGTRSHPRASANSRRGTRSHPTASANSRCGTRSRPRASANSRCGTRSHPRAPANSRCGTRSDPRASAKSRCRSASHSRHSQDFRGTRAAGKSRPGRAPLARVRFQAPPPIFPRQNSRQKWVLAGGPLLVVSHARTRSLTGLATATRGLLPSRRQNTSACRANPPWDLAGGGATCDRRSRRGKSQRSREVQVRRRIHNVRRLSKADALELPVVGLPRPPVPPPPASFMRSIDASRAPAEARWPETWRPC